MSAVIVKADQTRTSLARIQGVAESYRVLDKVSKANNIPLKKLDKNLKFEIDGDTAELSFKVKSTSKDQAVKILSEVLSETKKVYGDLVAETANLTVQSLEERLKALTTRLETKEKIRSGLMAQRKSTGDDRAGAPVLDALRQAEAKIKELENNISDTKERELKSLDAEAAVIASTVKILDGKSLNEVKAEEAMAAAKFSPEATEYKIKAKALEIAQASVDRSIAAKRAAIIALATPALKEMSGELSGLRAIIKPLKESADSYTGGRTEMTALARDIESDSVAVVRLRQGIEDARSKAVSAAVGWAVLQEPLPDDDPVKKPIVELGLAALLLVSAVSAVLQIYWPFGRKNKG